MFSRHARKWLIAAGLALAALVAATIYFYYFHVRIVDYAVPERVENKPAYDETESVIVTSIGIPLRQIQRGLEADLPRNLWSIDRKLNECVPRRNIRIFGENITRTPKIGCRITGEVKRGSLSLRGRRDAIVITFPINAVVRAKDIGGVIKQETATAEAMIELTAKLGIGSNWQVQSNVDLSYRWIKQPGVDFLGQRIKLTSKADKELVTVIANIERSLERQIRRLNIRGDVQDIWTQAFLIESLSRENPPAWLRLTPQSAGIGRFRTDNGRFSANVLLRAKTEILVGEKPSPPAPIPLGSNEPINRRSGFSATIPVLADYAEVEPVILQTLRRLAAQGIERDNLGELKIEFRDVTLYPTIGGKIAVGIDAQIEPIGTRTGGIWGAAQGEIWLTGTPVTEINSEIVRIRDLEVFGDTDTIAGDLLLRVMASDEVRAEIEAALVEDFASDYDDIVQKAKDGVASVRLGDVTLRMDIDSIEHSPVQVTGSGLFMVLSTKGSARASLN